MKQLIREAFETYTLPNFRDSKVVFFNGEYNNDTVQEHWETFQEGWESAVKVLQANKINSDYTDILSTGGYDPRNTHPLGMRE
jgi:hypothetical protein